MKPYVFLYEAELRDFLNREKASSRQGIAYCFDSNSVIHGHQVRPAWTPSGLPISFHLLSADSLSKLYDCSIEEIGNYCNAQGIGGLIVIVGTDSDDRLQLRTFLRVDGEFCEAQEVFMPAQSELSSRSKGILETDILKEKSVFGWGVGSIGSLVMTEMGKSGVKRIGLADGDRLDVCNIWRHVCDIDDLGRFKTLAMRDKLLRINPCAEIVTFEENITYQSEAFLKIIEEFDIIIGATDTDQSRFMINETALRFNKPAIIGRAIPRAAGGDVLRIRPYEGPCQNCLFNQGVRKGGIHEQEVSREHEAKKLLPDYARKEDIEAIIQVGLSTDIAPISNMMVKLAQVELSRGLNSGISSLEDDLEADFYIWANRRERAYSYYAPMQFGFDKPSILRWYGARVDRDPECIVCGTQELKVPDEHGIC